LAETEEGPSHEDARSSTLSRAHVAVVALVTCAALVGTVIVVWSAQPRPEEVSLASSAQGPSDDSGAPASPAMPTPGATVDPGATASVAAHLVVHVAGDVHQPGVVRLPSGSRVVEAIEAAGGALPGANLEAVNLARVLADGEQVRVGLPPDPSVQGAPAQGGTPPAVLNLNSATAADLESLPGVGPVLATRIVTFRDENGPFRSVDQLIDVPGIGPAVLADVTQRVSI